jgi:hypothetical protein
MKNVKLLSLFILPIVFLFACSGNTTQNSGKDSTSTSANVGVRLHCKPRLPFVRAVWSPTNDNKCLKKFDFRFTNEKLFR